MRHIFSMPHATTHASQHACILWIWIQFLEWATIGGTERATCDLYLCFPFLRNEHSSPRWLRDVGTLHRRLAEVRALFNLFWLDVLLWLISQSKPPTLSPTHTTHFTTTFLIRQVSHMNSLIYIELVTRNEEKKNFEDEALNLKSGRKHSCFDCH